MQINQGHIVNGSFPNRVDKTLAWLTRSRDIWKEKCIKTKLFLKRQTFAAKRLKEGRNTWRITSIRLKQELSQSKKTISALQQSIQWLESQVEILKNDTNDLKKKSSRTTQI
jgi:hypothetical protein